MAKKKAAKKSKKTVAAKKAPAKSRRTAAKRKATKAKKGTRKTPSKKRKRADWEISNLQVKALGLNTRISYVRNNPVDGVVRVFHPNYDGGPLEEVPDYLVIDDGLSSSSGDINWILDRLVPSKYPVRVELWQKQPLTFKVGADGEVG